MVQKGLTLEAGIAQIAARLTQLVEGLPKSRVRSVHAVLICRDLWYCRWYRRFLRGCCKRLPSISFALLATVFPLLFGFWIALR